MTHLEQSAVSRHKCLIYDGEPSDQLPVVIPLLMEGLVENWRCLYLGSPESVQMVDTVLERKGVDTTRKRTARPWSSLRTAAIS